MSVELVKLIKSIAMDAVRASNPTEVVFGTVSKDYENDGQCGRGCGTETRPHKRCHRTS